MVHMALTERCCPASRPETIPHGSKYKQDLLGACKYINGTYSELFSAKVSMSICMYMSKEVFMYTYICAHT